MIKFGTGGWRAVIGDDFIRENITRVAAGVAELRRIEGGTTPIIIGYDRRFLSDAAAKWPKRWRRPEFRLRKYQG